MQLYAVFGMIIITYTYEIVLIFLFIKKYLAISPFL